MITRFRSHFFRSRLLKTAVCAILVWLGLAYVILPSIWHHYEHHPQLECTPKTTLTAEGIPGDPLNVGLLGDEIAVIQAMIASGWVPADPITLRTTAKITASAVLGKPYSTAPVSNLFLWGRVEDLAFEQPVPGNARQRHHVRLWKSIELGKDGRPMWIGAATFDRSVGLSHLTGKITHHINADVDQERDKMMEDLRLHGCLTSIYQVTGVGSSIWGRNGGGDKYYTDGELTIGDLCEGGIVNQTTVTEKENPVAVRAKKTFWECLKPWLKKM